MSRAGSERSAQPSGQASSENKHVFIICYSCKRPPGRHRVARNTAAGVRRGRKETKATWRAPATGNTLMCSAISSRARRVRRKLATALRSGDGMRDLAGTVDSARVTDENRLRRTKTLICRYFHHENARGV